MRGKVTTPYDELTLFRITPAHAGKSFEVHYGAITGEDHPRTCGEKL